MQLNTRGRRPIAIPAQYNISTQRKDSRPSQQFQEQFLRDSLFLSQDYFRRLLCRTIGYRAEKRYRLVKNNSDSNGALIKKNNKRRSFLEPEVGTQTTNFEEGFEVLRIRISSK
jgi:hypothetical protein